MNGYNLLKYDQFENIKESLNQKENIINLSDKINLSKYNEFNHIDENVFSSTWSFLKNNVGAALKNPKIKEYLQQALGVASLDILGKEKVSDLISGDVDKKMKAELEDLGKELQGFKTKFSKFDQMLKNWNPGPKAKKSIEFKATIEKEYEEVSKELDTVIDAIAKKIK